MSDSDRNTLGVQGRDRTTSRAPHGEEEELELYGVWVKAGPEDVEEPAEPAEDFALSDFDDDLGAAADFEIAPEGRDTSASDEEASDGSQSLSDSITDEEEELLSSLEDAKSLEEPDEEELSLDADFDADSFGADTGAEEISLPDDDLSLPEEDLEISDEDLGLSDDDLNLQEEELSLSDDELTLSDDELSLPDEGLEGYEETLEIPEEPITEFDSDAVSGLGEPEGPVPSLDLEMDSELTFPTEEPTISLDEPTEELMDEHTEEPAEAMESDELPILSMDDDQDGLDLSDLETEETEQFVDNLPELELDESELTEPLSADESFDDLGAVEAEMSEPSDLFSTGDEIVDDEIVLDEEPAAPATPRAVRNDDGEERSLSVLQSIEQELHSIRDELRSLKAELSTLRNAPSARSAEAPAVSFEEEYEPSPAGDLGADGEPVLDEGAATGGFFEEDEDETIALTGDELDNILNTAEFTEEAGEPTEMDDLVDDGESLAGSAAGPESEAFEDLEPDRVYADDEASAGSVDEISLDADDLQDADDVLRDTGLETEPDESPIVPDEDLPIEEITLEEESGEVVAEDEPETTIDLLGGDESEVDALAKMDIESELAEIEELEDETEEDFDLTAGDLDLSFGDETESDEPTPISLDDSAEPDSAEVAEEEIAEISTEDEIEAIDLDEVTGLDEVEELSIADVESSAAPEAVADEEDSAVPAALSEELRTEIKSVLKYMDQLLEALPEDKIKEFARSQHFVVYKKLFEELGLEQ